MRSRRMRRIVGMGIMGASLLVGALSPLAASAAEGDPEDVPEETTSFTLGSEEIPRMGFWNGDPTDYTNNLLTKQFPPEILCLVLPQACFFPEDDSPQGQLGGLGNDLNDTVDDTLQGTLGTVQEADPGLPADPVPPDSLPVSVALGHANHRSAIEFPLPDIPEGEEVESFTLFLEQGNPTYHNSSPALRQAVLAGLTCARECATEEFEKIVTKSCSEDAEVPGPCLREDAPLLVEMCPIVDDPSTDFDDRKWDGARSQDEETVPAAECLFGDLGTLYSGVQVTRPDGSTAEVTLWGFDLTLALQAWNRGDIPYAGVLLRPGAAENLAYGDPDPTFNKQVTFQNAVYYAAASAAPPQPISFDPPPATSGGGTTAATTSTSGSSGSGSGGDLFGTPPTPVSNSPIAQTSQPQPTADQPAVAEQPQTAKPEGTGEQTETLAANAPLGQPETPWWLWLLVIPFIGGAWLLQHSLAEEMAAATRQEGAMTRLLERQATQREPDLVTN